jgi:hypothetical protein
MATGFTQSELDALMHSMDSEMPRVPRRADKILADPVKAMRAAGTEKGVLFVFEYKGGVTEHFWLNVWIAKELAAACHVASLEFGWLIRGFVPEPSDHIREPKIQDIDDAAQVTSLATNGEADGMLVRFAIGQRSNAHTLYLPVPAALTVLSTIATGAATAEWWDPNTFELIPCRESQN